MEAVIYVQQTDYETHSCVNVEMRRSSSAAGFGDSAGLGDSAHEASGLEGQPLTESSKLELYFVPRNPILVSVQMSILLQCPVGLPIYEDFMSIPSKLESYTNRITCK